MDERVQAPLQRRVLAALAALLPQDLIAHPDATALREPQAPPPLDEGRLARLCAALALSEAEQVAVALAAWCELDAGMAAALSLLQGNGPRSGGPRPTLGLVARLAEVLDEAGALDATRAMAAMLRGTALSCGLLQWADPGQPAHARGLLLPMPLLPLLAGDEALAQTVSLQRLRLRPLHAPDWPLPRAWQAAVADLVPRLLGAGACVLVLRGADAQEMRALARAVAVRAGREALEVEGLDDPGAAPEAEVAREGVVPALLLAGAWPVWAVQGAPGSVVRLSPWPLWPGPCVVLAAPDVAFDTALPLFEFELGLPDAADRVALWAARRGVSEAALAPQERDAVARSRCGISVLAQAAASAEPVQAAIGQAVRRSARALSAWAQLSSDRIPADAWVGPAEVRRELGLLLTRCLARADACESLGPLLRGRTSPGVKALFIGASGTGKTLAAQWLADRLARPLVRVDLAAVVSKYIGETEKNLAQLLARAEHLDAVLLFDEADSLFGARTDVKQANDRYANMQTNYLLQRLETFGGVAVLTSNSKARFDDAFLRRLDAVLQFQLPDVAERRQLWRLHLGETGALDAAALGAIAALADLPGGHIRNAVFTAALLARQRAEEGEGGAGAGAAAVCAQDLREALALEYRKLGQRAPDSL
ncbi:ATP-binding protein [Azohydromonas aeria]|uniref:ATP-binding protein n=1 Tax=Azohydromonas aeria TaxID=2590212 RepID=UPI0018E0189F|nr:ATP-binding protein [Azohydromonas aeria]